MKWGVSVLCALIKDAQVRGWGQQRGRIRTTPLPSLNPRQGLSNRGGQEVHPGVPAPPSPRLGLPSGPESQRRLPGAGGEKMRPPLWSVRPARCSAGEPPARMVMVGPGPGSHRRLRLGQGQVAPAPGEGPPGGQGPPPSTPAPRDVFTVHEDLSCALALPSSFPGGEMKGPGSLERAKPMKGKPFCIPVWKLLEQFGQTS